MVTTKAVAAARPALRFQRAAWFAVVAAVVVLTAPTMSRAQNDWQFPDPYFGILEIEKSRPPGFERRYRAEITPAPRPQAARPRPLRPWRRHARPVPFR